MVLPSALGAAVAASAAILKAKCTLLVGANECAPTCARKKDPWAPRVDLRDDAEKRAEAQQKLEEAEKAGGLNPASNAPKKVKPLLNGDQVHKY